MNHALEMLWLDRIQTCLTSAKYDIAFKINSCSSYRDSRQSLASGLTQNLPLHQYPHKFVYCLFMTWSRKQSLCVLPQFTKRGAGGFRVPLKTGVGSMELSRLFFPGSKASQNPCSRCRRAEPLHELQRRARASPSWSGGAQQPLLLFQTFFFFPVPVPRWLFVRRKGGIKFRNTGGWLAALFPSFCLSRLHARGGILRHSARDNPAISSAFVCGCWSVCLSISYYRCFP